MKQILKTYPKINEDIYDIDKWYGNKRKLGSTIGSLEELISKFRSFYKEAHSSIFDSIVKEVWLEQQITVGGLRRIKRVGNGIFSDIAFGRFTKIAVGTSHRVLTANFCFTPIASYLIDLFPDFLLNNPFENPEKYKYPYKNVSLDYLVFVYQMDNRLEILEEAEKRCMSYAEFVNWVYNWALCHNEDIKDDKYKLVGGALNWPYIRNNKLKRFWENNKFNFNTK